MKKTLVCIWKDKMGILFSRDRLHRVDSPGAWERVCWDWLVLLDLVQLVSEGLCGSWVFRGPLEERTFEGTGRGGPSPCSGNNYLEPSAPLSSSWPTRPLPSLGPRAVLSVHHCIHFLGVPSEWNGWAVGLRVREDHTWCRLMGKAWNEAWEQHKVWSRLTASQGAGQIAKPLF